MYLYMYMSVHPCGGCGGANPRMGGGGAVNTRHRITHTYIDKTTAFGVPRNPAGGFRQHPPGIGSGHGVQCETLLGEPFLPWELLGCCDVVRHTVGEYIERTVRTVSPCNVAMTSFVSHTCENWGVLSSAVINHSTMFIQPLVDQHRELSVRWSSSGVCGRERGKVCSSWSRSFKRNASFPKWIGTRF